MTKFQMIEKRMSDEEGDHKFHSKKDDAMGEKNKCCGSTHGYTKQSDGTLKCIKCGKVMNPVKLESCGNANCKCTPATCKCKQGKKCDCAKVPQKQYDDEWGKKKKSKFESYEADVILEKLGSLDAMDASELGVPANTPITLDMLKSGFKRMFMKNKNADHNAFYSKIKSAFKGATPEELAMIRKQLENAVINVGEKKISGDVYGGK